MFLTTRDNPDRIHILRRVALVKREEEARNFLWWSWFLGHPDNKRNPIHCQPIITTSVSTYVHDGRRYLCLVTVVQRIVYKPDNSRAIRGLRTGGDEHSFGKMTPCQLLNRDVSGDGLHRPSIFRHPALLKRRKILTSI